MVLLLCLWEGAMRRSMELGRCSNAGSGGGEYALLGHNKHARSGLTYVP